MLPEVQALVRLQDYDHAVTRLETELAELPKRLDALQKEVAAHSKTLVAQEAKLKADETERRKLEGDVELHKSKIVKLKKQLNEAQNLTQTQALEHEITWAEQAIAKAEERELELLMEEEQLRAEIGTAKGTLLGMQKSFETERQQALARHKAGLAELATLAEQRKTTLATLTPQVASIYERLRKKHKNGVVAVEVVNTQCQGCFMEIRLQLWQELRAKPTFMTCENCGRVLYLHAATGFDPQIGPAAVQ
jgi:predicted  nucleic acid-binding Zn-ribbon protein